MLCNSFQIDQDDNINRGISRVIKPEFIGNTLIDNIRYSYRKKIYLIASLFTELRCAIRAAGSLYGYTGYTVGAFLCRRFGGFLFLPLQSVYKSDQ
jgi:hypothetical protein